MDRRPRAFGWASLLGTLSLLACGGADDAASDAADGAFDGAVEGDAAPTDDGGGGEPDAARPAPDATVADLGPADASPCGGDTVDAALTDEQRSVVQVPQTESWTIPGLESPVEVVRTQGNIPHVYARTRVDLGRAMGFILARDRYFFMELQRRLGLGRISELLGDAGLARDMRSRQNGISAVADRLTANLSPDLRAYMEAVVVGVNTYIGLVRAGELPGPSELALAGPFLGARNPADLMQDFELRDLMAMAAVVLFETNFETDDIGRTARREALATAFEGAPKAALRASGFRDDVFFRHESLLPRTASSPGFGTAGAVREKAARDVLACVPHAPRFEAGMLGRLAASVAQRGGLTRGEPGASFGSNAWAVAGSKTAHGGALVAGDGHLALSVPALTYQVGMDTQLFGGGPIHQRGAFLTPLPILGFGTNGDVAWSMVNPYVDLTDWYAETVTLGDDDLPASTRFQGEDRPMVPVDETYVIANVPVLMSVGRTETWPRYETFDGRRLVEVEGTAYETVDAARAAGATALVHFGDRVVAPGDVDGDGVVTGISFDYAALDATRWPDAIAAMGFATDVTTFREATRGLVGGGLFSAAGDRHGDVLYSSYQAMPCRRYLAREGDGYAAGADPQYLLDGETYGGFRLPTRADGSVDDAAGVDDPYACVIPFDAMPQSISPEEGFVFTANNEPASIEDDGSVTNDPWYLGGPWEPARANTIRRRLQEATAGGEATVQDMAAIQADHQSRMGERFTPHLLAALQRAAGLGAAGGQVGPSDADRRLAALHQSRSAAFEEVARRLAAWTFDTPAGVDTFYHASTPAEREDAVATMIFNAWLPRFSDRVFGDEPSAGLFRYGSRYAAVPYLARFLDGRGADNPLRLSSHDPDTGESVFFDDVGTPEVESADEVVLLALADALDFLASEPTGPAQGGFGTTDMRAWSWGLRHQVRFQSLLADYLGDNPALLALFERFAITTDKLPLAPDLAPDDPRAELKWFPRPGDNLAVDAANHAFDGVNFTHGNGPVARMVIALSGDRVQGQNIIPGGQSGLVDSPFFSDQAAVWLGNEAWPLRFHVDEVVEGALGRERLLPPPPVGCE